MRSRWISIAVAGALAVGVATVSMPAGASPNNDMKARTAVDSSRAIVQLVGDPIATSAKTKPAQGKKINWAGTNVRSYRATLSARRNEFKKWLQTVAPKAKITGEFEISVNAVSVQLNGATLDLLRTSPLVIGVSYEAVYTPTVADPDLDLISAVPAWSAVGGSASAGAGIRVGVVDSGIDIEHPCFADTGYPLAAKAGDPAFTNNKVVVARVFNNRTKNKGYTAEGIGAHGTHVAGTIACNFETPATVDGVAIPYAMSGVAPRALLGNYNVFPSNVEDARSEDILNALDAAALDGMDVINMSLGGGSHGVQDLLTNAVDNLDRGLNIVVAVSAGNEGPGHDTVGSPGMAARALTAGASTVPHFVGPQLTVGADSYGLASGDFAVVAADLTAPLGVVAGGIGGLGDACAALPAGSLTGEIAVLSRGTCAFSVKIRNAQTAGAIAVVVANNVAGDPTAMGSDGTADQPTIPAYMVALSSRAALVAADGQSATIGAALAYVSSPNADIMAGFSSQGPTDVDRRVKPDVVAPGVNVLSSIPVAECGGSPCFAFFSGTSMASPHLAGMAAVVRQAHGGWSAAQVRSAIVNSADEGVLTSYKDGTTLVSDPNIIGSGSADLLSAVGAQVLLDPVSISFGRIPSGSGQTRTAQITITNTTGHVLTVQVVGSSDFSAPVSIPALATSTITVSGTSAKGAAPGQVFATLRILDGSTEVAHAVLFYEIG